MRVNLAALAKRAGKRRSVGLRVIQTTGAQAGDLAAIYLRVVRAWIEDVNASILPAYDLALTQTATRDGLTRDDVPDIERAIQDAADKLSRLILTLTPDMRTWVVKAESWHRAKWVASALSAAGVDLSTIISRMGVEATMEAVLARNMALIRSLSDQHRDRISQAVWQGFTRRTPRRDVARAISDATAKRRALFIASDQTVKLAAALDDARMDEVGLDEWIWRSSHKAHPRPEHAARDGKHYTNATAPADLPGQLPHCGCKKQAWLDLD